ncbi:winged helix-turn-helix domain-containing protein [Streptomyces sp. NBC_01003]|uniref:BTAD domain-containing putative transcriptional regulator n=1 Tax=Streptomyces sp. NBC_01003 TaxID=2903714 RepID=UPI00386C8DEE|nr:winged helix-turn-helix domain-containing protein [Streptomyces sp. NBC_01003]
MRYRILGSTQALRDDGTAVPVGGARLRALLTVLALRPGRTVPPQVLTDEVWGADPPADASGALQALVGRLRRAIGADAVHSLDGGYRLSATSEDIDLFRFERLVRDGVQALADGDPGKSAAVLDDALSLWRGPALADLPDRSADAARWEALHLESRRTRFSASLALGRAESVLPELTALCDAHPLDEPLQALRLRALRDAGRTAEALAAYERVRVELAERLGTDPGPELRALHADLLTPRAPAHAPTASAERPTTPVRAPAHTGNLRARLTSFVGRAGDIGAIREDLGRVRLVTLLGPGGAGKTRLSQETAESMDLPDGVWLAELAPVEDPDAVPEAVVTALGARETVLRGAGAEELRVASDRHGEDPLVRLTEHCAHRRMLLILDNCEHVIEAAARLAEQLLSQCPGVTVLATSREPLGVPGELLHLVEPLPEPFALRLFGERGAAVRPGFRVEDDERAAAEICRRLDGLPLAIELAAARLRMLTPRQIADRLDDRFRLLTSGARTVLPRQQTLRAVVDWSWDLLDEEERTVLRRLSVFSGGCDLAAAEAVCGPGALDAIGSLVDKSLVVAAPWDGDEAEHEDHGDSGDHGDHGDGADGEGRDQAGVMRYRLLETVAEYAGDRLDEAGDRADAERAHLTYYRELARTTDPQLRGHGQRAAVARLEREYENLRTALRHAVAARDEQETLSLVLSLAWFWQMRDLRVDARNWSREATALGPDPFTPPADPAPPLYERCTDAPPPFGPELLVEARRGVHLLRLAYMDMEMETWQTEEGGAKLRAIAQAYRPGLPQTCRPPGNLWFYAVMMSGDMEALWNLADVTVRTCRELGYTWELALTLQLRANILANRSDWAGDAVRDADESLELFTRLGDRWGVAEALSARGEAHERSGAYAAAAADYSAAIEGAERLGAQAQVAILNARLGQALIEGGDGERGEELLRGILDPGRRHTNEAWPAARMFLAGRYGATGRVAEAREQLRLLQDEFKAMSFVVFRGFVVGMYAWLDSEDGLAEEALAGVVEALELATDPLALVIAPHMPAMHLVTGARALNLSGDPADARDAARLMGAADGHLPSRHVRSYLERDAHTSAEAAIREAIGDRAYEAAYAEGGDLSLDEAAALLGRERG